MRLYKRRKSIMAFYLLGDCIREQRERLGVTQEELCEGICSVPTLSKIENGKQGMRLNQYIAIMERLGLPVQQVNVQVTEEERKWYSLKTKVQYKTAHGEWDIKELISEMENCIKDKTKLEEQFILFNKAVLDMRAGRKADEVLDMLNDAMKCTYQKFGVNKINKIKLFTTDEILIALNIAIVFDIQKDVLSSIKLGFFLKEYMENGRLEYDDSALVYPLILFDLSNWVAKCNRFEEALELCDTGIEYCNKHGKLNLYTELIYNKSRCLFELNRDGEAKKYLLYAYCISDMRNDTKMKDIMRKSIDELKINIII